MSTSSSVQPILVLLGQPVAGNPTQFMMERAFARHELDWRFVSLEVAPEDLADAVRGMRAMGFFGGNCTDPHKQAIIPLLDRTTEAVQRIGAANCIFREEQALVGENTEGRAFLDALRRRTDPAGKRVVLLGAGRLARAIAVELAQAQAAEIVVVNRTVQRGQELVELLSGPMGATASFALWDDDYLLPTQADVLVGATPADPDALDEPLPIDLGQLSAETVVADVTYNPARTWLVREASRRGAKTMDGLEVFLEQAAINFRLWTGVDPDPTVMREAVEEFLEL